jgi:hypothetical protein
MTHAPRPFAKIASRKILIAPESRSLRRLVRHTIAYSGEGERGDMHVLYVYILCQKEDWFCLICDDAQLGAHRAHFYNYKEVRERGCFHLKISPPSPISSTFLT